MTHTAPVPRQANVPPCHASDIDPEIFFPDKANLLVDLNEARATCGRCPLATRRACVRYAIDHDVEGIWAGTTYADRNHFRAERGIKPLPIIGYSSALPTHQGRRLDDERTAS